MRALSLGIGLRREPESELFRKIVEGMRTMLNTDQQVLDKPLEISVAKVTAKSRTLPFIIQVAVLSVLLAVALSGFAWWRTGSAELVWPWLRGERLVFQPTRIDFGQVPKAQILQRQIRVVNLSSKPLTLLGSQPSCGCISLDEFPIMVPAGKAHVLTLKIGTPEKAGSFEHFIKFFSDDQGYSSVVVTVSGVVQ